jgi:hypothetical protein
MGRASRGRLSLMLGLKGQIENMTRQLLLGTGLNVTSFVELTDQRHFGKGFFTNAFIHFYDIIALHILSQLDTLNAIEIVV